jgi:hypothetical protein
MRRTFQNSNQMFSYILKRSFLLIMNMGLIIMVLNFNFANKDQFNKTNIEDKLNFLFQGRFDDITSDWYI